MQNQVTWLSVELLRTTSGQMRFSMSPLRYHYECVLNYHANDILEISPLDSKSRVFGFSLSLEFFISKSRFLQISVIHEAENIYALRMHTHMHSWESEIIRSFVNQKSIAKICRLTLSDISEGKIEGKKSELCIWEFFFFLDLHVYPRIVCSTSVRSQLRMEDRSRIVPEPIKWGPVIHDHDGSATCVYRRSQKNFDIDSHTVTRYFSSIALLCSRITLRLDVTYYRVRLNTMDFIIRWLEKYAGKCYSPASEFYDAGRNQIDLHRNWKAR